MLSFSDLALTYNRLANAARKQQILEDLSQFSTVIKKYYRSRNYKFRRFPKLKMALLNGKKIPITLLLNFARSTSGSKGLPRFAIFFRLGA